MDFLERLEPGARARLVEESRTIHLSRGEVLIHRGEPGGDVYLLETGTLEAIDSRSEPAIILARIHAGDLVGEMAFLSEATRTADVRAAEDCVCRWWSRSQLQRLVEEDPSLGRSLFRTLAELVVERSRQISRLATEGALGRTSTPRPTPAAARHLADPLREVLMASEPDFRRDPADATRRVRHALDRFRGEFFDAWQGRSAPRRQALGAALGRELHPYLIRSHLAEYALDRASGASEDPLAVEHLHRDEAGGDGELGDLLDRWLLDLPTAVGLRRRSAQTLTACRDLLASGHRVVAVNGSRWPHLSDLVPLLLERGCRLTLIENDRASLRAAMRRLDPLPADRVRPVLLPVADALLRRHTPDVGVQEMVIVWGLLDYLPDRLAIRLLRAVATGLAPGGHALVTALAPSDDAPIFDHLLGWPTVRRSARHLVDLATRAGLDCAAPPAEGGVALVVHGCRGGDPPAATPPRPPQGATD
ncbi:MAG: cyclic nucleotide-binding domain-containing protein [Deltaproteobacteria bacterium]|nr:MAG: cyclic nucleotide-binding domain-containing protein [Deltaproteobacteria bacterium]